MGKKKPQLLPQVHSEDGSIDVDLARVLQFHYNAAKRIPPFCYSKLSFNFSALSRFEPLLTKLCREIADSAAVMQRDVAAQEKSRHEKESSQTRDHE